MAIGLGKMLGFDFPMNFNYPYISNSATDFWRRWHISLSTWFREYLYIPLGGNRVSAPKHIRNLFIVWLLTGLWHGASWTFVLWGLYWGILLLLEKYVYGNRLATAAPFIKHLYSILAFVFGWLIFSSEGITDLGHNFSALFGLAGNAFADAGSIYYLTSYLILLILCGFFSTPFVWNRFIRIARNKSSISRLFSTLCYAVMLLMCIASLVNASYNPFLYFRF